MPCSWLKLWKMLLNSLTLGFMVDYYFGGPKWITASDLHILVWTYPLESELALYPALNIRMCQKRHCANSRLCFKSPGSFPFCTLNEASCQVRSQTVRKKRQCLRSPFWKEDHTEMPCGGQLRNSDHSEVWGPSIWTDCSSQTPVVQTVLADTLWKRGELAPSTPSQTAQLWASDQMIVLSH